MRELLRLLEEISGRRPDVSFDEWRPGDQPWYVSNTAAFRAASGWRAEIGVRQGLERLSGWLQTAFPAAPAGRERELA